MSDAPVKVRPVFGKAVLQTVNVVLCLLVIEFPEAQPAKIKQASHGIAAKPQCAGTLEIQL